MRETHQIAHAQQEKNAKLREAFGISEYFVEGTSFDPDRKAREELAKSEALQKEIQEREREKEAEKAKSKRYAMVRTPSHEKDETPPQSQPDSEIAEKGKSDKKKKKKRNRDG